jgi:hypothetical protein
MPSSGGVTRTLVKTYRTTSNKGSTVVKAWLILTRVVTKVSSVRTSEPRLLMAMKNVVGATPRKPAALESLGIFRDRVWLRNGGPERQRFGDIYSSRRSGVITKLLDKR